MGRKSLLNRLSGYGQIIDSALSITPGGGLGVRLEGGFEGAEFGISVLWTGDTDQTQALSDGTNNRPHIYL